MKALAAGDISVVVQGPVTGKPGDPHRQRLTLRCLASVREQLPGAEIVLSTWRGADVTGLPFDRLVESDDPGGLPCDAAAVLRADVPTRYNANRQIVSTRAGLAEATRPYAVKLRSDMLLTGAGFLRYFGRYTARHPEWKILRDRVVTANWYSRNPHRRRKHPFHPSDWFHFGRREDLLRIWDLPLAEPEVARWFDTHPRPEGDTEPWLTYRYTVEQFVWLSFLRKYGEVRFDHKMDLAHDAVGVSELTIANNLVIATTGELGIRFLKYPHSLLEWATLYTHGEWQRLYRRYCDPAFRPGPDGPALVRGAYALALAPAHEVVLSPRTSPVGRVLSAGWEARSPRSFRAAKSAYLSGLSLLGRLSGR